jgi:Tfp pilus assembly protein PilX
MHLNQKGLALLTVFFIFLVALIVVGAIAIISVTEIGTTRTNLDAEQAFNLAEAGIDWAKAQLAANYTYSTTGSFINTPNIGSSGTALVKVENPGGTAPSTWTVTITAKGFVSGTASRAIQASYHLTRSGTQNDSGLFQRPITANGRITSGNNSSITVDTPSPLGGLSILSNYDGPNAISFGNNLTLTGSAGLMPNATSVGISSSQIVKPVPPDPVRTLTSTEIDFFRNAAIQQGHYYSTSQTWGSGITLAGGTYFVEGSLAVDNRFAGNGTLVVNGNMTTDNKLDWDSTGNFALVILGGGVSELDGANKATIAGLVYCNGDITFKNSCQITGALSCRGNVEFKNNLDLQYLGLGYGGQDTGPPGWITNPVSKPQQLSWQEVAP